MHDDRPASVAETGEQTAKRLKTDEIDFPVDLDLEMVLGDMPQKVGISLIVDENVVLAAVVSKCHVNYFHQCVNVFTLLVCWNVCLLTRYS